MITRQMRTTKSSNGETKLTKMQDFIAKIIFLKKTMRPEVLPEKNVKLERLKNVTMNRK